MTVTEIMERIRSTPGDGLSAWETMRDAIVMAYATASTHDRVELLRSYHDLMDAVERQISPALLATFRAIREKHINGMLMSSACRKTGPVSSPSAWRRNRRRAETHCA